VTIENPFVSTALPLPDTTRADVTIEATLRNHGNRAGERHATRTLRRHRVRGSRDARTGAAKTVKLDPSTTPALRLDHPKLWWPAGYGEQNLYPVQLSFETADKAVSDSKRFQTGVRQFTYTGEGNDPLRIFSTAAASLAAGATGASPK